MAQRSMPQNDVKGFRTQLVEEKARLEREIQEMKQEVIDLTVSQADERPTGSHMADLGTDMVGQEIAQAQIQTLSETLFDIDDALGRIDAKSYGFCVDCHQPIPVPRLRLMPYVARDVACQMRFEKDRRRLAQPVGRPFTQAPGRVEAGLEAGGVERRAS